MRGIVRGPVAFAAGGYPLGVSLHGLLAYGSVVPLLIVAVAGVFARRSRRSEVAGLCAVIVAGILLLPVITTGMFAHCTRVWRAAGIELIPPNLPWYRLARDAGAPAWESSAIAWHVWIGGAMAGILVFAWVGWPWIGRCATMKRMALVGPILGIVAFAALSTGFGLGRHGAVPPAAGAAAPPWSAGEWDDPASIGDSLVVPLYVHVLATGLSLSAGMAVIGLALRPQTSRKTLAITASCAAVALVLTAAAELWLVTNWQPARFVSLLRQPRDAAYLTVSLVAIGVLASLLWASRRGRNRITIASVIALGILLAATFWFLALTLYDGSDRASDLWRFQQPYVQRPSP
jgi:hypothetical protein